MLLRILFVSVVTFIGSRTLAEEPEISDDLRQLSWMVGDWSVEKVWTKEGAGRPKIVITAGNPDLRVSVIENGNALQITYVYKIVRFDDNPFNGVGIEYRCTETLRFNEDHYALTGSMLRSDKDKQPVTLEYEYEIGRGCLRDWADKFLGTDFMTLTCGEPGAPNYPVFLVARRDDHRSLPNYQPFTPQTGVAKSP